MPTQSNTTHRTTTMSTILVPWYHNNPYVKLLCSSLEAQNIKTSGIPFTWHIAKRVIKDKVEIVHFHWLHEWATSASISKFAIALPYWILQLITLKVLGKRLIWTIHNLRDHERKAPKRDYIFSFLMSRMCDVRICHSTEARNEAANYFHLNRASISVIPHGNYISWYENKVTRKNAREKIGIDENATVTLAFGEIRPYKNIPNLIRSFISTAPTNAILLIAGSCSHDSSRIEITNLSHIDSRIRLFLEYIPDEEVQVYMNASDIVALTYSNILTSGAALLAMSFGKAILAPNIASFKELPGNTGGYLYDIHDINGISLALRSFHNSIWKSEIMGRKNYSEAKSLAWDAIAKATIKSYLNEF